LSVSIRGRRQLDPPLGRDAPRARAEADPRAAPCLRGLVQAWAASLLAAPKKELPSPGRIWLE
jgi:hypothetical protein